ncbi:hypothetical protein [Micromonospora globbae]|jgi:hypothetical protein|uniref:Uncharacterized protein n=1 Tax=Micromonospora globbae TaxID=1894969 RepID=A0A420F1R7_9ACTN|nr:hypothetical protein [Micromonospora globbae]RKF26946.1 hypothetical protein D7I43_13440 [Micromonospora globbae]WTF88292.1 hypothetical protein OH732_12280 [Micromonospora globbae]
MTRGEFALSAVIAGLVMAVAANQEAPREGAAPAYVDASPAALAQAAPTPGPPEHTAPAPRWPEDGGADAEVEADPVAAPQPSPIVDVFVEVSPSTVQPGFLVGIKASCHDNSVPAIVASDAFGRVQVQPQRGLLTAAPMVRERVRPGNYRVKLECRDGATASTMLQVVKGTPPPSRGPATGFGGTAGGLPGGLLLPGGVALTIVGAILAVAALRRPRTVRVRR